jgi:hypothetical protein
MFGFGFTNAFGTASATTPYRARMAWYCPSAISAFKAFAKA